MWYFFLENWMPCFLGRQTKMLFTVKIKNSKVSIPWQSTNIYLNGATKFWLEWDEKCAKLEILNFVWLISK